MFQKIQQFDKMGLNLQSYTSIQNFCTDARFEQSTLIEIQVSK